MTIELDEDGNIIRIKKKNSFVEYIKGSIRFFVGTLITLAIIIVILSVVLLVLLAILAIPVAIALVILKAAGIV